MSTVPSFSRGYRLRHDAVRDAFVILAPERLIMLDEPGVAIMQLVNGKRTTSEITALLAARFDAPVETIQADVDALLSGLRDEGAVTCSEA